MGETILEGQRIDERFQRRTWRAQRLRHVDGAGAFLRQVIGRADMGEGFAGGVVDRKQRAGNFRPQAIDILAHELFERGLQPLIDGELQHAPLRLGRMRGSRRMARVSGESFALALEGFAQRADLFFAAQEAGLLRARENAVASPQGRREVAVRPPRFGRLRQADEQCLFGEG